VKVFDRYQAIEVDLPEVVEPGRYRLLRRTVLNGSTELRTGDLLWSDGGSLCDLEGEASRTFVSKDDEQEGHIPDSIVDGAVSAVVDQLRTGGADLPSPVMPARLGDLASATPLELELERVMGRGHLQSIAARPRMAMRYESELLPVSRARRLANDAVTRLASHSEDWLRREITGVIPRTLKAEVSEDDVAIYENVVFARLLDRLEDVLRRRLREVNVLLRKHDQAMALANAERLDYRLRNALCSLWGLSFVDNPVTGKTATETFQLIEMLLGKVRQLKRSELYAAIPRAHRIPLALRSTNVLQHDTHYSCLRPLWLMAHASAQGQAPTPTERYAAEKHQGERFAQYVGLLIRHALAACQLVAAGSLPGQYRVGAKSLTLLWEPDQWALSLEGCATPLHFVPGWRGFSDWSTQRERRLVFCHGSGCGPDLMASDQPGMHGVLNPLEFYGVERTRQAIEQWLMATVLARYPFQTLALPTDLRDRVMLLLGDSVQARGRGLIVLRGPSQGDRQRVDGAVDDSHANASTRQALTDALDDAQLLSTCRVCGDLVPPSSFLVSAEGFRAECVCGSRWTFRIHRGSSAQASFQLGDCKRPFAEVGSLQLDVALQASKPSADRQHQR